jgi:hypothetical protein
MKESSSSTSPSGARGESANRRPLGRRARAPNSSPLPLRHGVKPITTVTRRDRRERSGWAHCGSAGDMASLLCPRSRAEQQFPCTASGILRSELGLKAAQGWGWSETRRLIRLLSAGWVPSVSSSRGFPQSRGRASDRARHITSSPPRLHPQRSAAGVTTAPLHGRHLAADRPQEGCHFAGDCRHDHR